MILSSETRPLGWLRNALPRLGSPGSRSAELHDDRALDARQLNFTEIERFATLRWIGTVGSLMVGMGALGAGAFPVVDNPYPHFPGGEILARMLTTSSIITLIGVGFLVLAWALMAPFVSTTLAAPITGTRENAARVSMKMLRRTFIAWVLPISLTTPLFTQDIYSYLAQGAIVAAGMDPYSGGPIDLLSPDNPLARSVPFIWAHSPSPYGPVALAIAAGISMITNNSIVLGVLAHRLVSVLGLVAAAWGVVKLAGRCRVSKHAALWLGILNPLCLLHLIGGIHNEAILIGFMLVGLEVGLRGVDRGPRKGAVLLVIGAALITCAGLVKVTGFIALGFLGMALARQLLLRGFNKIFALTVAAGSMLAVLVATTGLVTAVSGIGLGWITGQGGAATIRSWMSISTDVGVIAGALGSWLQLGDHTEQMLVFTRAVGVFIAGLFMLRMLLATLYGRIHPVGGLGVAMFVMVVLFPVVHPWYLLWSLAPLAAWANRPLFRVLAMGYSVIMSFFVLPRGLRLPPVTVLSIYFGAAVLFALLLCALWWLLKRRGIVGLH
ncbi:polyprenol phosphomannose-dependent alpha 1,6 mannosyltransferase MptB [Corynebacterium sp. H127]|uniref:polyprenol phosphomannose-dependent alpha 1,6 mannosyltransferase MptB n=1 Tax=Corynebacterium sp. H127 TaxID=3133418 RepID=UPI0030A15603